MPMRLAAVQERPPWHGPTPGTARHSTAPPLGHQIGRARQVPTFSCSILMVQMLDGSPGKRAAAARQALGGARRTLAATLAGMVLIMVVMSRMGTRLEVQNTVAGASVQGVAGQQFPGRPWGCPVLIHVPNSAIGQLGSTLAVNRGNVQASRQACLLPASVPALPPLQPAAAPAPSPRALAGANAAP